MIQELKMQVYELHVLRQQERGRERESGRAKSDGGGMINKMFMSTVEIYIIKFKSTWVQY